MKKLLSSLILVGLVVLACEGVARLAYRLEFGHAYTAAAIHSRIANVLARQSAAKANERGASGRAHPYYGFVASDDRPLPARRAMVDITASQLGFPGDTRLFDPSGKTFLVVITGGSVAHYFATDKKSELLAWLEKRPEFAGRTGRLLDTALPGYKEPQQLLIMSNLLALGVRPDVVINLDGFNETCIARKNLEVGGYPFMPWFWVGNDSPSRERLRLLGRLEFQESLRDRVAAFLTRLPALPALVGFPAAALDKLADNRTGEIENQLARESIARNPLARQQVSPGGGFYLGPNVVITQDQFADLAAAEWARASILMSDMVRAAGGRYFHALQPASPLWAAARGEALGPLCPETCVESGYPALSRYGAALAAAGVRFADLEPDMTATAKAFVDCCHVTPAGQNALFSAMTAFLARTWSAEPPNVNPDTALAALSDKPAAPFSGADLLATPAPGNVVTENIRAVERSSDGPYRTVLGHEAVICLPLTRSEKIRLAFGLKDPLPRQGLTVRLNGQELGTFALDKPDSRLEKTLEADFSQGLNTLSFVFSQANTGPKRNKNIPEGYAAEFTTLTLMPVTR